MPTVTVSLSSSGTNEKNWDCNYPQTVSWTCDLYNSMFGRSTFSISDGSGALRVDLKPPPADRRKTYSGTFALTPAGLGTGKITLISYLGSSYPVSGSVTFQVDTTAPSNFSKSISGARYVNGSDYWVRPNDIVTIKHRGRDTQSGMKHHYLRAYSSTGGDARTCPTSSGQWMTSPHIDLHGGGAPVRTYGNVGWNQENCEYTYYVKPITKDHDWAMQGYYSDMVGNNSGSYFNLGYTIRVDGDAPTISISPNVENKTATISASDSRSGVKTVQYAITSSSSAPDSWTDVSNGATVPITGEGTRYVHVRAYDRVDNVETSYTSVQLETQISELRLQTPSGIVSLPVFKLGDLDDNSLRISTFAGVGVFRLVPTNDSRASSCRVATSNGVRAISLN